jgi:hypothetical protein
MSDTARDYQTADLASIEGLDVLFTDDADKVTWEQPGRSLGMASNEQTLPVNKLGKASWVSVEQAAALLGISSNAVIKRLNKGKLLGEKVPGQFGLKWTVNPSCLPQQIQVEVESAEEQPETVWEQPGNSTGTAFHVKALPGTSEGYASESLQILAQVIQTQNDQIQAQTELIKHLTDEIRERDNQVKLLTDSQHKPGWWAKFSSWFFKGQ